MRVIGGRKAVEIGRHEILKWNREQFEVYLAKPDTRLMIIGYSFGDEHINDVLINAALAGRGLRLFIIDPLGADVLERSPLAATPTSRNNPTKLQDYVMGASRRPLRNTVNPYRDSVELEKVTRFFRSD
jgi:hypothetical protein